MANAASVTGTILAIFASCCVLFLLAAKTAKRIWHAQYMAHCTVCVAHACRVTLRIVGTASAVAGHREDGRKYLVDLIVQGLGRLRRSDIRAMGGQPTQVGGGERGTAQRREANWRCRPIRCRPVFGVQRGDAASYTVISALYKPPILQSCDDQLQRLIHWPSTAAASWHGKNG